VEKLSVNLLVKSGKLVNFLNHFCVILPIGTLAIPEMVYADQTTLILNQLLTIVYNINV